MAYRAVKIPEITPPTKATSIKSIHIASNRMEKTISLALTIHKRARNPKNIPPKKLMKTITIFSATLGRLFTPE